jgi:hypothetical protein
MANNTRHVGGEAPRAQEGQEANRQAKRAQAREAVPKDVGRSLGNPQFFSSFLFFSVVQNESLVQELFVEEQELNFPIGSGICFLFFFFDFSLFFLNFRIFHFLLSDFTPFLLYFL